MAQITKKKSIKVTVLNILASVFLTFQLIAYLNLQAVLPAIGKTLAEKIGFFIGYNLYLVISLSLFYWAYKAKQKNKKNQDLQSIDSIGEKDEINP